MVIVCDRFSSCGIAHVPASDGYLSAPPTEDARMIAREFVLAK